MNLKKTLFILFVLLGTVSNNVFCGTADTTVGCSVKNRWTIKGSFSGYLCFDRESRVMFGDFERMNNASRVNFRLEANYGFCKYMEIGLYAGFQHYKYVKILDTFYSSLDEMMFNGEFRSMIAPTFGTTLNFHILPIFVKEKNCRWDLYLSAAYGGCYLPHLEFESMDHYYSHYSQEYGIGMGISYYIKNRAGFFAEYRWGNFSFFSNVHSTSNFRAGFTCKI